MGTSGQGRRGISRDGDERIDGQTDERYEDRIRNGRWSIGGSPASTLLPTQTEREREREGTLASPRELPISSNRSSISPSSTSHLSSTSSPPSFSIAFALSFSPLSLPLTPPSITISLSSSLQHLLLLFEETPRYTELLLASPPTHSPARKPYTHTHERMTAWMARVDPREQASTDGRAGTHRSNLGSNISFLPCLVDRTPNLLLTALIRLEPRRDSGVRGLLPPSRRGCTFPLLVTPRVGTTGHPGGPLTRHDRPWDTGRNAPRSKTRPSERSSISRRTRPPRCFRVIRRETTTGFSTAARVSREGEEISMMMNFDGSMSGESREECC